MKLFHTFSHAILALFIAGITTACGGGSEPSAIESSTKQESLEKGQSGGSEIPSEIKSLLSKNTCLGCHKMDKKLIGPSFLAIAKRGYTDKELVQLGAVGSLHHGMPSELTLVLVRGTRAVDSKFYVGNDLPYRVNYIN